MSEEVNKRIVEMRLDNQQFETAGKKTLNTLDEMDRKLQFKDGEKGFAKVQKEADKLDFGDLIAAVDRVNARFSTMNLLGMTALVELEKQALRTGKRMIKSLTLDPVLSGMSEYETQIKSVQTILANTAKEGASIGKVNTALDELNRYADLTIYNFAEMDPEHRHVHGGRREAERLGTGYQRHGKSGSHVGIDQPAAEHRHVPDEPGSVQRRHPADGLEQHCKRRYGRNAVPGQPDGDRPCTGNRHR